VVVYGAPPFVVNSPDAPDIASVSLIALGSATHSNDMNQFYAELAFTKTAGQLVIAAPGSSDEAPPGYYMLFLVDSDGVPSVATIVRLATNGIWPRPSARRPLARDVQHEYLDLSSTSSATSGTVPDSSTSTSSRHRRRRRWTTSLLPTAQQQQLPEGLGLLRRRRVIVSMSVCVGASIGNGRR
jgi:hypothetical protein